MEIEVGKTYEVREPQFCEERKIPVRVTIIEKVDKYYPFVGDNYNTYAKSGLFNDGHPGPFDLVKEV